MSEDSGDMLDFGTSQKGPASIKVVGVGGSGGNAVNHMFEQGIEGVDFVLVNTDAQALAKSAVPTKVQIGSEKTGGRGAGNNPQVGRESAIEDIEQVKAILGDNNQTQMVFVTAGMGGGTGTGAAPIIAQASRELNILTVAIVTIPFAFEGRKRINQAIAGIEELRQYVDSLIVISNERIREMYGDLTISNAFGKADDVLTIAAKGIAEIITVHGKINVDFADVKSVMENSGVAIMGAATTNGENRASEAIRLALDSPLLNNADIKGAKNILLNITSGEKEVTMDEITEITDFILDAAESDVDIIWGTVSKPELGDDLNVTIIATGFDMNSVPEFSKHCLRKPKVVELVDSAKSESVIKQEPLQKNEPICEEAIAKVPETKVQSQNNSSKIIHFNIDDDDLSSSYYSNSSTTENKVQTENDDIFIVNNVSSFGANDGTQQAKSEHFRGQQLNFSYGEVKNEKNISIYENTPAYLRSGIKTQPKVKNSEYSKETLSNEDDDPRLRKNNSFLHDNVD